MSVKLDVLATYTNLEEEVNTLQCQLENMLIDELNLLINELQRRGYKSTALMLSSQCKLQMNDLAKYDQYELKWFAYQDKKIQTLDYYLAITLNSVVFSRLQSNKQIINSASNQKVINLLKGFIYRAKDNLLTFYKDAELSPLSPTKNKSFFP